MRIRSLPSLAFFCLFVAACADESGASQTDGGANTKPHPKPAPSLSAWQSVFTDLGSALTSVWGTSDRDVWLVGSDARDGFGPLVLHLEAGAWSRKNTGGAGDLWWVHGFDGGPVFFGGAEGSVMRYQSGRFERVKAPKTHGTVYGVWGADASEVWAVGGDTLYGTGAFVWKYTGGDFQSIAELPVPASDVIAYFKVWGTSKSDVWIVGTPGISLHYDGTRLERVDPGVFDPLFTVHASSSGTVAAVGGADLGVVLERTAESTWSTATLPEGTGLLTGVWLTNENGYAVGAEGTVLERTKGKWARLSTGVATSKALHSVWVDPAQGVWAVGGDVLVPPFGGGVLLHRGASLPTSYTIDDRAVDPGDAAPDSRDGSGDARSDAPPEADVESGSDARLSVDGGKDADPDAADGSNRTDSGPPRVVRCGSSTCSLATERCCADVATGAAVGCVELSTPCPTGEAPVTCDEPSDCSSGQSCCLNRYQQAGDLQNVQCQSKCVGPAVCQTTLDCGGAACATFSIMKSYMICPRP